MADIVAPLVAHNREHGPPPGFLTLALMVQDAEDHTIGGLWARAAYNWLFVEYLAVPASLRRSGIGSRLMAKAEQIAANHHCVGVWLDTFEFQALPFYLKLGYERFGQLDHPTGATRYFLRKQLNPNE